MNKETQNEFLLLFRGTDWHKGLSPDEIQKVMNQWKGWFDRLSGEGKVKGGQPLKIRFSRYRTCLLAYLIPSG